MGIIPEWLRISVRPASRAALVALVPTMVAATGCRDDVTAPAPAEVPPPVISFQELANRLLADPLLRRIAEQLHRPDVAAYVDAVLIGLRDPSGVTAGAAPLSAGSLTMSRSAASSTAPGDSTAVPTEEQILDAVLDLAVQTVALLQQASAASRQTTFQGVR